MKLNLRLNQFSTSLQVLRAMLLLSMSVCAVACFEGKIVTTKVRKGDNREGVLYALPKTVVRVDVPIDREDKKPGKYSLFAPCFFPDDKFIMVKSTAFSVDQDGVKFDDSLFIPDTDEIYLIKTTGGKFETKNLDLELTKSGVFVKATAENTNETIDVVTGLIETGVSLVGKAIVPVTAAARANTPRTEEQTEQIATCKKLSDQAWENAINAASSRELQTKLRNTKWNVVFQDPKNFDDEYLKAKEIADKIGELIARRLEILSTNTNASVPADSLKLILAELDNSIKTLKNAAFLGTTDKLTWNTTFRVNPRLANPNVQNDTGRLNIDLLTFSETHGVCSVDVNQGMQLDPRFQIKRECPANNPNCKPNESVQVNCSGDKIRIKLVPGEDGEGGPSGTTLAEKVIGASMSEDGERGFYYRVPGRAIAYLYQGDDYVAGELGRAPVSIAQFGPIISLPSSTGGRRTKYELSLYESSGGLKNFVMGSSALLGKSNVENLTNAASSALDTRAERKKAKLPKDELETLEKQRKILEEKKKIRDLEKDLKETSPNNENP